MFNIVPKLTAVLNTKKKPFERIYSILLTDPASQGWEIALRSKSLILKRDRERFVHGALYKRTTVSDLLSSIMTKQRQKLFALFYERTAH